MKTKTGKTSTRDVVLRTIKSLNRVTVDDLAEAASVSPVTVRHHLNSLQAEGLIESEGVRRKIGRPYHVYSLTEAGQELFPKKYFALSTRLLAELKEQFPTEIVNQLFENVVQKIVAEHRAEFEQLNFEDRLDYLVNILADEGFLARWEKVDDGYKLIEYSCPFLGIGHQHGEICSLDTALIEAVMGTTIEQHSCMLDGEDCCQFSITPTTNIPVTEVHVQ